MPATRKRSKEPMSREAFLDYLIGCEGRKLSALQERGEGKSERARAIVAEIDGLQAKRRGDSLDAPAAEAKASSSETTAGTVEDPTPEPAKEPSSSRKPKAVAGEFYCLDGEIVDGRIEVPREVFGPISDATYMADKIAYSTPMKPASVRGFVRLSARPGEVFVNLGRTLARAYPRSEWTGGTPHHYAVNPETGYETTRVMHKGSEYVLGGRADEVRVVEPIGQPVAKPEPVTFFPFCLGQRVALRGQEMSVSGIGAVNGRVQVTLRPDDATVAGPFWGPYPIEERDGGWWHGDAEIRAVEPGVATLPEESSPAESFPLPVVDEVHPFDHAHPWKRATSSGESDDRASLYAKRDDAARRLRDCPLNGEAYMAVLGEMTEAQRALGSVWR